MQTLLDNPILYVLVLAIPLLVLVTPFRVGWLLAVVVFFWADSSMVGADLARRAWIRAAVLLLVAFHGAVRLRARGRAEPPPVAALLLGALCVVSLLWADPFDYPAASVVFLALLWTVTFGLVARLAAAPASGTRTLERIVATLLLLIAVGFVPFLRAGTLVIEGTGRIRGFFNNPNGLGITCALIAPLLAVQATAGSGAVRIGRIALLVTVIGLAFLSGSRTGFGGVVAGVSVTLFVRHPSRYLAGAATLGAVAAIATLAGGDAGLDEGATGNLIRGQSISRLSGRLDRWATGLEMWRESPILGKGFMTSRKLPFIETREEGSTGGFGADTTGEGVNFHSQHVETLVDLGVVGEVLLIALGVTLFRRARRLARAPDPTAATFGAVYLGMLTSVSLDSFFHNWLLTPGSPSALLFWSVTAVALRLERFSRPGVRATHVAVGPLARAVPA